MKLFSLRQVNTNAACKCTVTRIQVRTQPNLNFNCLEAAGFLRAFVLAGFDFAFAIISLSCFFSLGSLYNVSYTVPLALMRVGPTNTPGRSSNCFGTDFLMCFLKCASMCFLKWLILSFQPKRKILKKKRVFLVSAETQNP